MLNQLIFLQKHLLINFKENILKVNMGSSYIQCKGGLVCIMALAGDPDVYDHRTVRATILWYNVPHLDRRD